MLEGFINKFNNYFYYEYFTNKDFLSANCTLELHFEINKRQELQNL